MKTSLRNFSKIACVLAFCGVSVASASLLTVKGQEPKKMSHLKGAARDSSSVASADSGGAHNGPATSGVSIPRSSDRGIRLANLNETIMACSEELVDSVAAQISNNVSGGYLNFPATQNYWSPQKNSNGETIPSFSIFIDRRWKTPVNPSIFIGMSLIQNEEYMPKSGAFLYIGFGDVALSSNFFPLPNIQFDDTFADATVDEFGRIDNRAIKVKNLRITMPTDTPDIVQVVNRDTKKPTSLTVNVRNYYNCLVNGVQQ